MHQKNAQGNQEHFLIIYYQYNYLVKLDPTNLNESILDEPFNNLSVTVCMPLLKSMLPALYFVQFQY